MSETITTEQFKELNFQILKRMKYRNVITEIDGRKFSSKKEAKRYGQLKILKEKGHILDFKMQVRYPIIINGIKICTYVSDFDVYWPCGKVVVEDAKGLSLPIFKMKFELMKAILGITIKII